MQLEDLVIDDIIIFFIGVYLGDGSMKLNFPLAPSPAVLKLYHGKNYNVLGSFLDDIDQHLGDDRVNVGVQVFLNLFLSFHHLNT